MRKALFITLGIAGGALLAYLGMVLHVAIALVRLGYGRCDLGEE